MGLRSVTSFDDKQSRKHSRPPSPPAPAFLPSASNASAHFPRKCNTQHLINNPSATPPGLPRLRRLAHFPGKIPSHFPGKKTHFFFSCQNAVTGNSISAIAFFEGRLYAADYSKKCIWYFEAASDGSPDMTKPRIIAQDAGAEIVDLVSTPHTHILRLNTINLPFTNPGMDSERTLIITYHTLYSSNCGATRFWTTLGYPF